MKRPTISIPSAPRAGLQDGAGSGCRHSYTRLCLALLSVLTMLLPTSGAKADVVSGNVFLQGDYVEVGIHPSGSFGTSVNAPAGFHARGGSTRPGALGFVADPAKDGWTVGTPGYIGDFFVPGTPEEGWSIEWNTAGGGAEHNFANHGLNSRFDVAATSLTETTSGDNRSAVWEGTATSGAESLKVTQTVRFNKTDAWFIINVTLVNTGTVPIDSVEYMRNVDPDNEQTLPSGSYVTDNYALNDNATNQRLIVGRGITYSSICGLGTIDSRAVVSTEGFTNVDPDAILDSPITPSEAAPERADRGIALAYRFGTLAPGQSVSIDYAYILNAADLTVALGRLASVSILQPTGTVSGTSVIFQGTTDNVATTTQMEFFVNGVSVGIDTTPDAGGVFESSFDSTAYANGTVNLKVVATFTGGATAEKTATVTVGNSGPPVAFLTPTTGQTFSGASTPAEITILDAGHPPVRVNFFRETAASGSVALGEDTTAPFQATFSVTDLPPDETVIIKAVAADSLNRLTTIQVSGTTAPANQVPVAGADSLHPPATLSAFSIDVLVNDSDPDAGDSVTVTGVVNGLYGTVVIGAGGLNVSYTPGAGYEGSDTFTYTITDTHGGTATGTVTLTNTAPFGLPDKKVVGNDTVNIPVLINDGDPDGDTISIVSVTPGALGATAIAAGGVDYDPAGTLAADDTFTYTITDGRGATATVTVTAYSLSLQSGFYVGFISDGTGNDGMALLRLSRAGSLSGTVSLNGLRYRTKGIIDTDGHALITISRDGVPVQLTLDLVPGSTPEFTADVSREATNWGGTLVRSPYSTSNPPPQLGRYTFVLPPDPAAAGDPAFPQGHGMGVALVSKSGKMRYAGRTADGAPFSCGSSVKADATSPLYGGLYRLPRGFVEGTITFRDVAGVSDFDGLLNWVKPVQLLPKPLYPAGFALQTAAIGSRYTRPASIHDVLTLTATSRVTVAMSEGGIAGVLSTSAFVGSLNPTTATPPLTKLTLSTINGKFNGTFVHPVSGQRLGLHGVVLQKQNLGFGYFSSKTAAGEVSMTPTP